MTRLLLALVLTALLSGAALVALWFAFGPWPDGIHLIVNGREVSLDHVAGWHAGTAGLAVLLALCIVALVLPLMLLLAALLPLLIVFGAVLLVGAAALGVGALALSPLVLLALLVWWLSRSSRRAARAPTTDGSRIDP